MVGLPHAGLGRPRGAISRVTDIPVVARRRSSAIVSAHRSVIWTILAKTPMMALAVTAPCTQSQNSIQPILRCTGPEINRRAKSPGRLPGVR